MNKQEGKVTIDMVIFGLICCLGVVYAVFKYSNAEQNDFNKFVQKVASLEGRLKDAEASRDTDAKLVTEFGAKIKELSAKVEALDKDVQDAQEHMGRMRKSQIDLRDRSYPRTVDFKISADKPIPVQFIETRKPQLPTAPPSQPALDPKLVEKVKKQIKKVSQ